MKGHEPRVWEDEYLQRTSGTREIVHVKTRSGLTYSYDSTTSPSPAEATNRVVAVWGRSGAPLGPRDALRMRGFPSPAGKGPKPLDRGHLAARVFGGGEDLNLIPQDRDLNQGRSPEGKRWRALEDQLAKHPATRFFVRPIYDDDTDFPVSIEFGVERPDGSWDAHTFSNR